MNEADLEFASPIGARFVPLHGPKAAGRVAVVDEADFELVSQYRWRVHEYPRAGWSNDGPYAVVGMRRDGKSVLLRMHNLVTGWARVDHENHDGLDNRRLNLRDATGGQNRANSKKTGMPKSSRYKGVYWNKSYQAWRAKVGVDGRTRYLGHFATEEGAARAYDVAALAQWGEYACTNFPASDYALDGAA